MAPASAERLACWRYRGSQVGIEQVVDAERLVHLVQMVHPIVGADHLAEVTAADPDQAVIGFAEGAGPSASAGSTGSRILVMLPRPLQEK